MKWYSRPLFLALIVTLTAGGFGIRVAFHVGHVELKEALFTFSVALFYGAFIGGIVKLLVEDHQKLKEQRANQAQFVTNMLADLKTVYDRAERARVLIPAHRSALTYGEEMRDLIEARVQLRNVIRALDRGTSGIGQTQLGSIRLAVESMEAYLALLTAGFEQICWKVSLQQTIYETTVERILVDEKQEPSRITGIENEAWKLIDEALVRRGFLCGKSSIGKVGNARKEGHFDYVLEFELPLDLASWLLRNEIQVILGGKRDEIPKDHADTLERLLKGPADPNKQADSGGSPSDQ